MQSSKSPMSVKRCTTACPTIAVRLTNFLPSSQLDVKQGMALWGCCTAKASYRLTLGISIFLIFIFPQCLMLDQHSSNWITISETKNVLSPGISMPDLTYGGDSQTTSRSGEIVEFISTNGLVLHNDGLVATFETINGRSFIDLTLTSNSLGDSVVNWEVEVVMLDSDHRAITFGMDLAPSVSPPKTIRYISSSTYEKIDKLAVRWKINMNLDPSDIETYINILTIKMQKCLRVGVKSVENFKSFRWWTPEI